MIRSMSCLVFLSCLLFLTPLYAATQTLTTYYPAPQGNYKDMTINEGLGMVDIGSPPSVPCPTTSFFSSIPANSNGNPIYLFNYTVTNNASTGPALVVCINGTPYTLAGASGAQGLWQKGAGNFIFPVQTAYNVGIGATGDPGFTLGVSGTAHITGNTTIDGNATLGSSAANTHTINGNVGIGVTPAASAPRLQAVAAGGYGTEPMRAQSNSTFFSGADGSSAARFAINNDYGAPGSVTPSTTLNFYGNDANPSWFRFMSVDNSGNPLTARNVTFGNDGGNVVINQNWGPPGDQALSINSNQIWKSVTTGDSALYLQWSNPGTVGGVGRVQIGGQGCSYFVSSFPPPPSCPAGQENDLWVFGGVWAYGPAGFSYPSDLRLKQNILPLTNALAKIDQLHGVSFEWKPSLGYKKGVGNIGLIAQELQKVYPQLVNSNGPGGYLSVDYGKFSAVLLQSVKELKSQMNGMQQQIDALQKKVKMLEKQK